MSSKPLAAVYVLSHPLIQHKASLLRNKNTKSKIFRECLKEISLGVCYEATRDLALKNISIQTPLMQAECPHLTGTKIVVIPVLRAGLGMVDGFLALVPNAKVGLIGMSRNHETFQPSSYCCKLPEDIADCHVFIVDPMLATGGSASATIQLVKEHGAKNITLLNVLAVPEGIERIQKDHPDVTIYVASLDEKLNESAYILPGLGDAGDRLCGTSNPS
ncbi:uracil phosphoribosyltransferase [Chlamydia muridarum]|uniref:uracil phosphoribosyltransferase n=1 Tax=Chlamydia muridarum TaxID=83560 RepID=UPI00049825E1|nr:uracil phosphoribosyltransferase [Chlamydia muridarum]AIT91124.1 uracil phosphoribosyltransferase [Chlamydia muridarum]AIT92017.1 uracil phosphoribosyltransferase [Chlamydia muridarum]AIW23892.1 uracil phosphoribosyltransferase [Chlamydia muridarum]